MTGGTFGGIPDPFEDNYWDLDQDDIWVDDSDEETGEW